MKRLSVLVLTLSLIVNLAAPAGAVFAAEEEQVESEYATEMEEAVLVDSDNEEIDDTEGEEIVIKEEAGTSGILSVGAGVATSLLAPEVVIAQIQVGMSGDAKDEYVSVYNNGNEEVDITDWCVRNKKASNYVLACFSAPDTDYVLEPHAYISLSSKTRHDSQLITLLFETTCGQSNSGCIVATNDVISLVNKTGDVVDRIEWTKTSDTNYAIERLWDVARPRALKTGDNSWVWKERVSGYEGIMELVECSDGTTVAANQSCPVPVPVNLCTGILLSEIAANTSEQFIEIQNTSDDMVWLAGCQLQTNRNTRTFIFHEEVTLEPGEYMTVFIVDTELTLIKTTTGTVYLLSSDGRMVDSREYRNLAKETSWSRFGEAWHQTYVVTPGAANKYEQYAPCAEGYWRNEETGRCNKVAEAASLTDCGEGRERNPTTGRCRNIPTEKELAPCKEGQYRSEETNRCRSIALAASSLKPCADDQFRNPETNRCKKIASADELADCGEGRERNPATNRCRNVLASTMPTAGFAPEAVTQTASGMLGWWVAGGVSLIAVSYAVWQWRFEIGRLTKRVGGYFTSGSK